MYSTRASTCTCTCTYNWSVSHAQSSLTKPFFVSSDVQKLTIVIARKKTSNIHDHEYHQKVMLIT